MQTIGSRITVFVLTILGLVMVMLVASVTALLESAVDPWVERRAFSLVELLRPSVAMAADLGLDEDVSAKLETLAELPDVIYVGVFRGEKANQIWRREGSNQTPPVALLKAQNIHNAMRTESTLHAAIQLNEDGDVLALGVDLTEVKAKRARVRNIILLLGLGVLGLAMIIAPRLGRHLTNDIVKLQEATRAIVEQGNIRNDVVISGQGETHELAKDFNALLSLLRIAWQSLQNLTNELSDIGHRIDRTGDLVQGNTHVVVEQVHATKTVTDEMEASVADVQASLRDLSDAREEGVQHARELMRHTTEVDAASQSMVDAVRLSAGATKDIVVAISQSTLAHKSLFRELDEVGEAFDVLTSSTSAIASAAEDTLGASNSMAIDAEQGEAAIRRALDGFEVIDQAMGGVSQAFSELEQRTNKISGVIEFIDGIAAETNLLALNASIIAAQAGEYGQSFGVVALQIKALAQQVAGSTEEIAGLTEEILAGSGLAKAKVEEGKGAAKRGVDLGETAETMLMKIVSATGESHQAAKRIVDAVGQQRQSVQHANEARRQAQSQASELAHAFRDEERAGSAIEGGNKRLEGMSGKLSETASMQSELINELARRLEAIGNTGEKVELFERRHLERSADVAERLNGISLTTTKSVATVQELRAIIELLDDRAKDLAELATHFKL
ncbi:MAG: hypothetical protein GY822_30740 [Deltaproteobacteria bacterium]|nr:hypothetical protein [Deltaproteobacteria bacterium]